MHKVHRPDIVRPDRWYTIFAQLRLKPPLGGLVAQLQPQICIKAINLLHDHVPTVAAQDAIHPPVAVADMRLADLLDALPQKGRIGPTGLVVIHLPVLPNRVDNLVIVIRP